MPKVVVDKDLKDEVAAIINTLGSGKKAADAMGVDRTMVWRFNNTGRAIEKNRKALKDGIARYKNETKPEHRETHFDTIDLHNMNMGEDLKFLRSLCNKVLTILDGYENLMANGAGNH